MEDSENISTGYEKYPELLGLLRLETKQLSSMYPLITTRISKTITKSATSFLLEVNIYTLLRSKKVFFEHLVGYELVDCRPRLEMRTINIIIVKNNSKIYLLQKKLSVVLENVFPREIFLSGHSVISPIALVISKS